MVSYVGVPLEGTLQVALWCWYCNKVAIAVKYAQVTVRRVSYKVCGGEGGGALGFSPPPLPPRNLNYDVIVASTHSYNAVYKTTTKYSIILLALCTESDVFSP